MNRASRVFQRVLGLLSALLLLALGLLVFYQAAARYVTILPSMLWTEEIARGLLIWLVMLGAGWGAWENTHFRLGIFEARLGRAYPVIGCLATLLGGAYLVWSAIPFLARGMKRVSQVSGLPASWVYSAALIGGVLILVGGLAQAWRLRRIPARED